MNEALQNTLKRVMKTLPEAYVLYVGLTRKGIGIPVVRVLVEGDLQPIGSPLTLASNRMLAFAKNINSNLKILQYEELYMGIYPH